MNVEIVRSAQKEIEKLPKSVLPEVRRRILALADDPMPRDSKKLRGSEHYRIRADHYRIIYIVDQREQRVVVTRVRHRRDAYR